ncbi:hypothetical protein CW705_04675 [Candidatus Bathyarchaeota archaeon]|nr:MAG: hypothetical protein CW705_04675 [Candidatus Bathyarchaeota archaeon]
MRRMRAGRSRKRIKFELVDESGDKMILIFEGRLNREKLMQVADLIELYGGISDQGQEYYYEGSKLAKLTRALTKYFSVTYFTSRDAVEAYISEYREPISLSTAATYLMRLTERGFLERRKFGGIIRYRIARPNSRNKSRERCTERSPEYDL